MDPSQNMRPKLSEVLRVRLDFVRARICNWARGDLRTGGNFTERLLVPGALSNFMLYSEYLVVTMSKL